jgi:hypothetical protein
VTSIVGVLCADGAVIGTDSSTTFTAGSMRTIEQPADKIDVINQRVIVAGTGQVGLGQRFSAVVEAAWTSRVFAKTPLEVGKALAKAAIEDFTTTSAPKGQYGALVAFPCRDGAHLCELAVADFQPELKTIEHAWYCSMGSAQLITDPFLGLIRDVFWKGGLPTLQEGIFATTWTLQQAVDLNPGGVQGPIRLAVLEKGENGEWAARKLDEGEVDLHRQSVQGAKDHLAGYAAKVRARTNAPEIPRPSE